MTGTEKHYRAETPTTGGPDMRDVLPFLEQRDAEHRAKRDAEHRQRMFVVTFSGLLVCIVLAVAASMFR